MTTIDVTEVENDSGKLWSEAANGPVTVLDAGLPITVVLPPAEYAKLTSNRRGLKAGFGKHLFPGVDMNALLAISTDDVFEGYR